MTTPNNMGGNQSLSLRRMLQLDQPLSAPQPTQVSASGTPATGTAPTLEPEAELQLMPNARAPVAPSSRARDRSSGGNTESYVYNYYLKKGLNPAAAAGITGNLYQESAFRPDVLTGRRMGDAGMSGFAAQWQKERLTNLKAFARARGENVPSLETQLDFVLEEGNSQSPYADWGAVRAMRALKDARSPEQASDIFRDMFERPSADDRRKRQAHARRAAGLPYDPNFQPNVAAGDGDPSSMPVLDRIQAALYSDEPAVERAKPAVAAQAAVGLSAEMSSEEQELAQQGPDEGLSFIEQQLALLSQQQAEVVQRGKERKSRARSAAFGRKDEEDASRS